MNTERAAEMIAMLTAKVASIEPSVRAFGSSKPEDVALALSLVRSVPARLIARIKYADQTQYAPAAADELVSAIERGALHQVVTNIAAPQRWKIPRPGFIRDLCRLALYELINPPLCPECKGRTFVSRRRKGTKAKVLRTDCQRCMKTGKVAMKDVQRCELLGIEPSAWAHSWKEKYHAVQYLMDKYEGIALGGVAKRLR